MANAVRNDKIIGGFGVSAAVVFIVATIAAIFMNGAFTSGSAVSDLFPETVFAAGCVIAGILGAIFGLLMMLDKDDSKVFIGKIRGILVMLTGVVLAVLGATQGEQWAVYAFILLIILAAVSDMFYDWVTDQKVIMIIALFFTLIIALTGILSQTGDNNLNGFVFVIFAASWVILVAALRFAPVVEAEPESKKSKKAKEQKKNAPTPKPYPAKKEEPPAQKKPATEKPVYQEKPKETEVKKEEPIKVMSSKDAAAEAKKEEPKLKVMSSKEAAAAREARKKEEPEPEPEPKPEPVPEPEPEPEPEPPEEEEYGDLELEEDTPDALLRRATWNKGLRCRRNYGEYQIPIAYVKAKVAVYVQDGPVDAATEEKLKASGWTVLCYKEKDISDGKEQAEEIGKAVKENIRAERAAKKKKKK